MVCAYRCNLWKTLGKCSYLGTSVLPYYRWYGSLWIINHGENWLFFLNLFIGTMGSRLAFLYRHKLSSLAAFGRFLSHDDISYRLNDHSWADSWRSDTNQSDSAWPIKWRLLHIIQHRPRTLYQCCSIYSFNTIALLNSSTLLLNKKVTSSFWRKYVFSSFNASLLASNSA